VGRAALCRRGCTVGDDQERDTALARAARLRERGEAAWARELLLTPAARCPTDVEVAYRTAWAHDALGLQEFSEDPGA